MDKDPRLECAFLDRSSSIISSSKVSKEVFYHLNLENISNDRRVLHRLRNNGEELPEQIHQSIELQDHPYHSPPHKYHENSTKETYDTCETKPKRESGEDSNA